MKYVIIFLYISIKFFFVTDFFIKQENFMQKGNAFASVSTSKKRKISNDDVHYSHSPTKNANKILAFYILKDAFRPPKLTFNGLNTQNYTLKDFKNNLIILYFWATWCTECRSEISSLKHLINKLSYDDIDDIKLLGISQDFKSTNAVQKFWQQQGLSDASLFFDTHKELIPYFAVRSLPTTLLIDKRGWVIARIDQPLDWADPQLIAELLTLKEAAGEKGSDNVSSSDIITPEANEVKVMP